MLELICSSLAPLWDDSQGLVCKLALEWEAGKWEGWSLGLLPWVKCELQIGEHGVLSIKTCPIFMVALITVNTCKHCWFSLRIFLFGLWQCGHCEQTKTAMFWAVQEHRQIKTSCLVIIRESIMKISIRQSPNVGTSCYFLPIDLHYLATWKKTCRWYAKVRINMLRETCVVSACELLNGSRISIVSFTYFSLPLCFNNVTRSL